MGTPDFAVPCLNALINNKYNIVGVVTQPDKPVGRSGKLTSPPVKELAVQNSIKVYQPAKVREPEFIETLKAIQPDIIIVVAFGQILPLDILNIPKLGCINVHASLLPKYRGAAPIQWSIINGETVTGVTTMYMDKGMDTGDTILKEEIQIGQDETSDQLFDRLSQLGSKLLIETITQIEAGVAPRFPQDNNNATYAPMLKKEDGLIDWSKSGQEIKNFIRGMYPWPGSFTYYKGSRMKVFNVEVENRNSNEKAGTILGADKEWLFVQTGEGMVKICEIQFDGAKRMLVRDYLVGNKFETNIILDGDNNGAKN